LLELSGVCVITVLLSTELTVFLSSLHQDHDLQDALGTDAKADGAEHVINMKGVGTFRVADGHDTADEQRRLLAKRSLAEVQRGPRSSNTPGSRFDVMPHTQVVAPLAGTVCAQEKGAPVSMRTIYVMVALAVGLACFLLWLLFGGSRGGDQARSIPPLDDLWALAVRAVAQWSATLRSLCWVDQEVAAPPFLTARSARGRALQGA